MTGKQGALTDETVAVITAALTAWLDEDPGHLAVSRVRPLRRVEAGAYHLLARIQSNQPWRQGGRA